MIRLVVSLVALLAFAALRAAETQPAVPPEMPKLSLATIDGKSFDLAQQGGKWVVVNFWATWCAPCLKEMPDLSRLDREHADLVVVGLAFEEIEKDELVKFVAAHPVDYPIALVDVYAPPADFPVPRGLPTTWLIGPEGRVAEHWLGPVTSEQILKAVAKDKAGG